MFIVIYLSRLAIAEIQLDVTTLFGDPQCFSAGFMAKTNIPLRMMNTPGYTTLRD